MFKKRRAKGALRTKRALDEDAADGDEEAEAEQLELIRDLRSEQRDRRRVHGVESNNLLSASEEAVRAKKLKLEEEERGLQEDSTDVKALITNQFTQQTGNSGSDDKAHESRMQAFIDSQMGVTKDESELKAEKTKTISEEDDLYALPDVLKSEDGNAEGLSGNAAPMFMGTGIAEVALPMEFRLKNIRQTEEARQQLEAKREEGFRRRDRKVDKRKCSFLQCFSLPACLPACLPA